MTDRELCNYMFNISLCLDLRLLYSLKLLCYTALLRTTPVVSDEREWPHLGYLHVNTNGCWVFRFFFFLFSFLSSSFPPSLPPSLLPSSLSFFLSSFLSPVEVRGELVRVNFILPPCRFLETQVGSAALVANTSIFWSVSLAPLNICGCFRCCCLVLLLSFSWGFMFGWFLRKGLTLYPNSGLGTHYIV